MLDIKAKQEHNFGRQTGRIDFIDVSKGIGVILVVFSHIVPQSSIINAVIYSFHVHLFFVLAGLFARPEQRFIPYLRKNAKRLLLPYVIFFLIGLVFTTLINGSHMLNLRDVLHQFVTARPTDLNVGAIWFLPCMFDVTVLFYIFHRIILSKYNTVIIAFSLGVLCVLSYYLPRVENKVGWRLPFKLDVAFMALVFYSIGYLLKSEILYRGFFSSWLQKIFLLVIAAGIVFFSAYYINGLTNLSGGLYGSDLYMYLLAAFCGSILIIVLSSISGKIRILSYIGKNSLIIFSLHTLLIIPFNDILRLLSVENSWYVSLIGTFAIVVIMMGVCFLYHCLESFAKAIIVKTE